MAKGVSKTISVFLDGKAVENSAKAIEVALKKATAQINNMTVGSKEYILQAKKIKDLKKIQEDHNKELQKTGGVIDNLKKKATELQGTFQAAFFASRLKNWAQGMMQEYVDAFRTLDDAFVNVQKYTGMSRQEVEALNDELKKMDTRTPVEQLNKLAAAAGDMGYRSKEDILSFVAAADKINQTLGASLGEDAAKQINKLTQVFGEDKTKGIQGATLATASAINELDKQTNASAKSILDFTTNMAAVGKAAGLTQADIIGLGATLNAQFQDSGASATQLTKVLIKMYEDPAKFAKAAGMQVKQFTELIKTDANAAMLQLFENINKKGGFESLVPVFKELGIGADRSIKIFTALAQNTDEIRKNQELANKTYIEGTSILNDFNKVNNNAAAAYEKAKNKITEAKQELGESLMPLMIKLTEGTASLTKSLSELTKWATDNIAAIGAVAAAYGALFIIQNKTAIITKAELVIHKLLLPVYALKNKEKREAIYNEKVEKAAIADNIAATKAAIVVKMKDTLAHEQQLLAVMKKQKALFTEAEVLKQTARVQAYKTYITKAETAEKIANTAATNANAAAQRALNVAKAATPWGAILTAATLLTGVIWKFATRQSEATKAMKEFNKEAANQEAQAKYLFDALKKAEVGSDEYKKQLERLKELYPDIIAAHISETGELRNIEQAYNDVTTAIRSKIAEQMKEKAINDAITTAITEKGNAMTTIRKELEAQNIPLKKQEDIIASIETEVTNMVNQGRTINEVMTAIGNTLEKDFNVKINAVERNLFKTGKTIRGLIGDIYSAENTQNKSIAGAEKSFSPFIKKPEAKPTDDPDTVTCTGDYKTCSCSTCQSLRNKEEARNKASEEEQKEWQKFQDKLTKLAEDRRKSQLIGFEKERDQINSQYDALIKEAEKFGERGKEIVERLEKEKGEAVIAAGEKYLQKFIQFNEKIQEEMEKLAQKTNLNKEESALVNSLLGSEKEWNDKIKAINTHLEALEDMYSNATSNEERANIMTQMDVLHGAELEAVQQQQLAKVNIIKKYTQEVADFEKQTQEEKTYNALKEHEKQIANINKKYNTEIKKAQEAHAELLKLQQAGNETIDPAELKRLEDLIEKLKELRDSEISVVVEIKETGNHWIEKLFDMDWANFTDDWQGNLQNLVAITQGAVNDMMQLWNSINQIAINNMQKELNAFKKSKDAELKIFNTTQDKKKKSLNNQVQQGIISQEYYNAQMEQLEQERADEEKRIADEKEAAELAFKKEQFRRDKQAAIVNAIIQGAMGIVTIWATAMQLGPIAGPIAAGIITGLIAGLTAAQIGVIASQPEPYRFGGFTGKKKNKMIQVNEEGEEWIASNKLLKDRETSPIIQALEQFQRGNKSPVRELAFSPSVPDAQNVSQAASTISHNFTPSNTQTVVEKHYYETTTSTQNNDEMIAALNKLNKHLEKPIPAVISRDKQQEFENFEAFLKKRAKI